MNSRLNTLYSAVVYMYIDLASSAWITPLAMQGAFSVAD